jgi:hypothetical protein
LSQSTTTLKWFAATLPLRIEEMPILATKSERQRVEYKSLTSHYRGIGPAAVLAALIFSPRKQVVSHVRNPQVLKNAG